MMNFFKKDEIISTYTRAQAIKDGVLVDITNTSVEAGIKHPVALTNRVWSELIVPVKVLRERYGQSEEGRLWDVVWMLRSAIIGTVRPVMRYHEGMYDIIHFQLYARMLVKKQKIVKGKVIHYKRQEQKLITLKASCGPGDNFEPVITVMMPDED
ncbi:hypothetical protein SAMN05660649_04765 [Desulfotomaculum arcticum]|uniref:Uncharacterized protein n=1 Tax=Desulfotruncus arcticus DSM 17038 TaxID=1121424 RepID=A0A1I2Z5R7_9FIRM|nr:DUF6573 family protein [Desulfotruncus arcticus]SFH33207.1 hypothetical protein SAMN05660649_04765 [Desulfotomaculum arcticum] [Desulfotruncus arcticus DSM 17038]